MNWAPVKTSCFSGIWVSSSGFSILLRLKSPNIHGCDFHLGSLNPKKNLTLLTIWDFWWFMDVKRNRFLDPPFYPASMGVINSHTPSLQRSNTCATSLGSVHHRFMPKISDSLDEGNENPDCWPFLQLNYVKFKIHIRWQMMAVIAIFEAGWLGKWWQLAILDVS